MDLRRLRPGEVIVFVAGGTLLAALFLPWYDTDATATLSGWEALSLLDVILALIALFALSLAPVTAAQRVAAVPIAMDALVTLAGLVASALVLVRVGALPDGAAGRDWGLWLALAGALGISAGGALSMRDERPQRAGVYIDASGRPTPRPPEIEALPAPPPGGAG